jgi:dolichol kinase
MHLFMNEFLDHKDNGAAILSHFYLLTGCANSVWFEGCVPICQSILLDVHISHRTSHLLLCTGILSLGVGDALVRWSKLVREQVLLNAIL